MDLALFFRVVWRFRLLVAVGLSLAFALAFLSFVRVDFASMRMTYRESEQWESLSTLFVTTRNFELSSFRRSGDAEAVAAATERVTALTSLYQQLATTDPVLRILARSGPIDGLVQAMPVTSTGDSRGDALPMLTLSAIAPTPAAAQRLGVRHINAFLEYLRRDRATRASQGSEPVKVEVVRQPQKPTLLQPRKKTRPIFVFLAVSIATLGLAFVFENLRPRVRGLPADGARDLPIERPRRTA